MKIVRLTKTELLQLTKTLHDGLKDKQVLMTVDGIQLIYMHIDSNIRRLNEGELLSPLLKGAFYANLAVTQQSVKKI